jgi:hypothetical protein
MKANSDIQGRIRELLDEELTRRVRLAEERLPRACVYNHRHPLDSRKLLNGEDNPNFNRITRGESLPVLQTIGLCMFGSENPETWSGTICEDPIDACRCPPQAFTPRVQRDDVAREFEEKIKDLDWVGKNLPQVCALLWVLEEVSPSSNEVAPTEISQEELPTIELPWWLRLVMWVGGLDRYKLVPPGDR